MLDMDKLIFRDTLQTTEYYKQPPRKRRLSGRVKNFKDDLDNEVIRIVNLDTKNTKPESIKLEGKRMKMFIPSNIIDIWTRLEALLGLKVSGHTDTLTGLSNLKDELYKKGEIQTEQQYRNAVDKPKI